jgi:hypothetical protein
MTVPAAAQPTGQLDIVGTGSSRPSLRSIGITPTIVNGTWSKLRLSAGLSRNLNKGVQPEQGSSGVGPSGPKANA